MNYNNIEKVAFPSFFSVQKSHFLLGNAEQGPIGELSTDYQEENLQQIMLSI